MAYKEEYDYLSDNERSVIWDLRQIYVNKIVGRTLENLQMARTTDNYSLWYHILKRDLFTEVYKNLKMKEVEQIQQEIELVKKVISENKSAYLRQHTKAEDHEKIEDALIKLEKLLWFYMQKNKMFGGKEEAELM